MSTKSNKKKAEQLGMPHGTAVHHLRKAILFSFIRKLGLQWCFQCGKEIKNVKEMSIEHKKPWQSAENPKESFFDLDNIAFSHLKCNIIAAFRKKEPIQHGTHNGYAAKNCRCEKCRKGQYEYQKAYFKKKE